MNGINVVMYEALFYKYGRPSGSSDRDFSADTAAYQSAFRNNKTLYIAYIICYDFSACNIPCDMGVV